MFTVNLCDYQRHEADYHRIQRPSGTPDYLLLFFHTPMRIRLGEEVIETKENAFILYTVGTMQDYEGILHFENSFVHFSTDDDSFIERYHIPCNTVFYLPNSDELQIIFREIGKEFSFRNIYYEEKIDCLVKSIFIEIARQSALAQTTLDNDANIIINFYRARFVILTNPELQWTANSMAELTGFGVSQFYSYYKRLFKRSPKADLIDARITKAKHLLASQGLSVKQAAEESGFQTQAHFTRYFKKICGVSPSEYADSVHQEKK